MVPREGNNAFFLPYRRGLLGDQDKPTAGPARNRDRACCVECLDAEGPVLLTIGEEPEGRRTAVQAVHSSWPKACGDATRKEVQTTVMKMAGIRVMM